MSTKILPTSSAVAQALTPDVLRMLDQPGPRYTSYPTADRFSTRVGPAEHERALLHRQRSVGEGSASPVGVYLHVPFCESVCYYCACNKVVTRQHGRAASFLAGLDAEVALHAEILGYRTPIASLHLGGGTPTFLSDVELSRVMQVLSDNFAFTAKPEVAIEVDPRTVNGDRLAHLRSLGFNRISMGVQDFDPAVQQAIHRVQAPESVEALVAESRRLGFDSVNLDLIYGLPLQTLASLRRTLDRVGDIRPDRIALYAYAHLPQRFKPQRRIDSTQLPDAPTRLAMLDMAIQCLLTQGYVYIGMDHFALPQDELAVARRHGRLRRNFQGYTTMADVDLIGLGPSAIGRVGAQYAQNLKEVPAWQERLAHGQFAVERGVLLSRDDLVRRSVIMALMCQGRVVFESIELGHLIDFRRYFQPELLELRRWEDAGLLIVEPDAVELTDLGWFGVRAVAMTFDRHHQAARDPQRYSRVA